MELRTICTELLQDINSNFRIEKPLVKFGVV